MAKPESTEKAPAPARVKVALLKAHTHAGIDYLPGAEIEITETQAKALKALGTI